MRRWAIGKIVGTHKREHHLILIPSIYSYVFVYSIHVHVFRWAQFDQLKLSSINTIVVSLNSINLNCNQMGKHKWRLNIHWNGVSNVFQHRIIAIRPLLGAPSERNLSSMWCLALAAKFKTLHIDIPIDYIVSFIRAEMPYKYIISRPTPKTLK